MEPRHKCQFKFSTFKCNTLCYDKTIDCFFYSYNASTKEFRIEFFYDLTLNNKEYIMIMIHINKIMHLIRTNVEKEKTYVIYRIQWFCLQLY